MKGTIVQQYGPIYGEPVNGTVFGRPNGSVYVPPTNTISFDIPVNRRFIVFSGNRLVACASDGSISWNSERPYSNAQSQDLANYVETQVSADSEFTTILGSRDAAAGMFTVETALLSRDVSESPIEADATYYVRSVLMASTGVPVAVSDVIEVVGVVVE